MTGELFVLAGRKFRYRRLRGWPCVLTMIDNVATARAGSEEIKLLEAMVETVVDDTITFFGNDGRGQMQKWLFVTRPV